MAYMFNTVYSGAEQYADFICGKPKELHVNT